MIVRLLILNFGIIDRVEVDFKPGFTAVTGETGSGKSLILNAISALFMPRMDSSWVKPGADSALIEAVFDVSENDRVLELLDEMGYPVSEELVVRRVISSKGRSRVFVNHATSSIRVLKELKNMLLEIQSQRDMRILDSEYQLTLLDRFGRLEELMARYDELYSERKRILDELAVVEEKEVEAKRRLDYLNFVISEVEKVNPSPEEEEELLKEKRLLENVERLRSCVGEALFLISESEVSASLLLRKASSLLSDVSSADERVFGYLERLDEVIGILDELSVEMGSFVEGLEGREGRLEEIEARLDELYRLKLKYGKSIGDVVSFYEEALREKKELERGLFSKEELARRLGEIEVELFDLADELSRKRREAASLLEDEVRLQLGKLGFSFFEFKVGIERTGELGPRGRDRIEFLFSANPDVPLMPLGRVASGGELSRVLLALKAVFADFDRIPTLLLDEVDSGIGGKTAELVGEHLRELGRKKQIITVTHFPQVASKAHHHVKVEKVLKDGKTSVRVSYISEDEKVRELERMVGDIKVEGEVG